MRSALRLRPPWPARLIRSLVAVLAVGCMAAAPAHRRPHAASHSGAQSTIHAGARRLAGPVQVGRASYYSPRRVGPVTAGGKRTATLDGKMTAASPTLPLGTTAKVTNEANGRSVRVRVEDRGPYAKRRILDVSPRAARALGMTHKGVVTVKVRPIARPRRRAGGRSR